MDDVARSDLIRFAVWIGLVGAITLTSSVVVIRWAEHDQAAPADDETAKRWLIHWAVITAITLLVTAVLGGFLVFAAAAKWDVVLTWPFVAGPVVGAVTFFTSGLMGQFKPGSASCGSDEGECHISLGFGAALLSVVAAVALGVAFIVAHLVRRALSQTPLRGKSV